MSNNDIADISSTKTQYSINFNSQLSNFHDYGSYVRVCNNVVTLVLNFDCYISTSIILIGSFNAPKPYTRTNQNTLSNCQRPAYGLIETDGHMYFSFMTDIHDFQDGFRCIFTYII